MPSMSDKHAFCSARRHLNASQWWEAELASRSTQSSARGRARTRARSHYKSVPIQHSSGKSSRYVTKTLQCTVYSQESNGVSGTIVGTSFVFLLRYVNTFRMAGLPMWSGQIDPAANNVLEKPNYGLHSPQKFRFKYLLTVVPHQ